MTDSNATELLPCPFCGAFAQVLDFEKVDGDQFFEIQCSGKNCAVNPRTKGFGTLEEAIETWNRRAS
jgi:Lar family restriction alleviation protein